MERGDHKGGKIDNRAAKILMIVAAVVFLAAAAASVFVLRPSKDRIVEIVQDDEILYTIDLDTAEDMVFTVFYPQGDPAGASGEVRRGGGAGTDNAAGAGGTAGTGNAAARDGTAGAGSSNTITIQNGEIWVSAAECPDHTCMKMGKLRSKSLPIVCLPHHLIIRFQ